MPHSMRNRPPGRRWRAAVSEDLDLARLGRDVHDRVEDQVDERERPLDARRRHVADGDRHGPAARLGAQPLEHRPRQLDAMHLDAERRKRECDPPRADRELEHPAAGSQLREHPHSLGDGSAVDHRLGDIVVGARDRLVEEAVGASRPVGHRLGVAPADARTKSAGTPIATASVRRTRFARRVGLSGRTSSRFAGSACRPGPGSSTRSWP